MFCLAQKYFHYRVCLRINLSRMWCKSFADLPLWGWYFAAANPAAHSLWSIVLLRVTCASIHTLTCKQHTNSHLANNMYITRTCTRLRNSHIQEWSVSVWLIAKSSMSRCVSNICCICYWFTCATRALSITDFSMIKMLSYNVMIQNSIYFEDVLHFTALLTLKSINS